MTQMQSVPASKQVAQLREQLLAALVEQEEAKARLEAAKEKVVAIRNVLAGIGLGQRLQEEIDAEAKKDEPQEE